MRIGEDNLSRAALGILAVSAGITAATLLLPQDPQPPGALAPAALAAAIGLLAVPALSLGGHLSRLLATENLLLAGIVYWLLLDPLQGLYPLLGATRGTIEVEFLAIGVFASGLLLGACGKGLRPPRPVVRAAFSRLSESELFIGAVVSFLLGMIYYASSSGFDPVTMAQGLALGRFSAPWSRGAFGGANAFLQQLSNFGFMIPSLTVLMAARRGWLRPRVLIALVLAVIMTLFLAQAGGRRLLGVVVGSAILAWVLARERPAGKVITGALCAALLLVLAQNAMLAYRDRGWNTFFHSGRESASAGQNFIEIKSDDDFLQLADVIELYPEVIPYAGPRPLFFYAVLPIPRFFWPGKPTSPGFDLAASEGLRGVTLSTTVIGELYIVGGLPVVLLGGLCFGVAAGMWNRLLAYPATNGRAITFGLGLMNLFVGLRSLQDVVTMSYPLLAWLLLAQALAARRRPQPLAARA